MSAYISVCVCMCVCVSVCLRISLLFCLSVSLPCCLSVSFVSPRVTFVRAHRVQGLMDAGVSVDSYGRCLHNREEGRREGSDRNGGAKKIDLLRQYKFAIAFENSPLTVCPRICKMWSHDEPVRHTHSLCQRRSLPRDRVQPTFIALACVHTGLHDREIHAGAYCRGDPDHSRTAEYQRLCSSSRLIHGRRVFRLANAAGAGSTYSV